MNLVFETNVVLIRTAQEPQSVLVVVVVVVVFSTSSNGSYICMHVLICRIYIEFMHQYC